MYILLLEGVKKDGMIEIFKRVEGLTEENMLVHLNRRKQRIELGFAKYHDLYPEPAEKTYLDDKIYWDYIKQIAIKHNLTKYL